MATLISRASILFAMMAGLVALTAFGTWPLFPDSDAAGSRPGTGIKADDSQFGKVLFSRRGQAVYFFDKEKTAKPRCYEACAKAWPPVLTKGRPKAIGKVRRGLLGTIKRRNGARQVTYAGHPLYYYAHEPVDVVFCHDVFQFDGLWLAARASGKPVG